MFFIIGNKIVEESEFENEIGKLGSGLVGYLFRVVVSEILNKKNQAVRKEDDFPTIHYKK